MVWVFWALLLRYSHCHSGSAQQGERERLGSKITKRRGTASLENRPKDGVSFNLV